MFLLFILWVVLLIIIFLAAQSVIAMSMFVWVTWFIIVFLVGSLFGENGITIMHSLKISGAMSFLTMLVAGVTILVVKG